MAAVATALATAQAKNKNRVNTTRGKRGDKSERTPLIAGSPQPIITCAYQDGSKHYAMKNDHLQHKTKQQAAAAAAAAATATATAAVRHQHTTKTINEAIQAQPDQTQPLLYGPHGGEREPTQSASLGR